MSKTKILGGGNIQNVKCEVKPPAMHGVGLVLKLIGKRCQAKCCGLNLLIFSTCGK